MSARVMDLLRATGVRAAPLFKAGVEIVGNGVKASLTDVVKLTTTGAIMGLAAKGAGLNVTVSATSQASNQQGTAPAKQGPG